MKLFVTYCLVLLFGCVHFSNDQVSGKTDHELEKQTTPDEVQQQTPPALSFAADIRPILETRCQPCHFKGGRMYGRLPFDTVSTVFHLKDELFTRIKDEVEQQTIKDFLSQYSE